MSQKYHVVGGGPAGLWTAKNIGREATLYEEHEKIGRPEHCTGLVSNRLEEKILKLPGSLKFNTVSGAKFFSNNKELFLSRGRKEATVIDRAGFDLHLSELAESNGAKIVRGKRVDPLSLPKSERVFVCEGIASRTAETLVPRKDKVARIPAVQYVVRSSEKLDTENVELHFLKSDFFAWVVPETAHIAKVGVATEKAPKELLETFLKSRFKSFIITERQGSHVVCGPPLKRAVFGNLVLVGDSAGQTKATTGGGIITGMLCAEIAAKHRDSPERYETEWRRTVGKELLLASKIRRVLNRLSDREYDELLSFAEKNIEPLRKKGDMDFHSGAFYEIFRNPLSWGILAKYMKLFFSA